MWGFESDLLHWKEHNTPRATDPNQIYDPVTGYNLRGRLDPKFTRIRYIESTGSQDYLAVSSGLRRRFPGQLPGQRHAHLHRLQERRHPWLG